MPKVSRESAANVDDHGVVEDRREDAHGTTIQFVTAREDADGAPLLKGLPDDRCPCDHWGYVFSGRLTFHFPDRDEVFVAGDAYHVAGGHTPAIEAGTEFLQFSPAETLSVVSATMQRNFQALMQQA